MLPITLLLAAAAAAFAPSVVARTPALVPPQGDGIATLAPDSDVRWVPFDLTPGNQIRFTLTLDARSLVAILDTGVSHSVLARKSAAADPARITDGGKATAIGGAVPIGWLPTARLSLGGLTRTGGGVTVADLPALATGSATPVDILVGRDIVAGQALDIDFANHRFRLLPSGQLPFAGALAPLSVSPTRRVYESSATIAGRRVAPLVLDTGDGAALTLSEPTWRAVRPNGLPTTTTISFGLAGAVTSTLAILPRLSIGERVAREVEVRVEPEGGFSEQIGVAGRIGSGFLQHYRVLLDPSAGRMVLQPGPDADVPPLRSTSGLLVGMEQGRLKVLHVMRDSPAAMTGWAAGDMICTIDGAAIPADYARSALADWSIAPPGTIVRLGLCGGATRSLTTRRFY
ncbi:hypothetical protein [Sphingomonas sp.]|uniref:hypothetical protein n=1 Tax=Sphingomonas sp. TaxID=28214 RepID=UPI00258CD2D8|nr:hypothetical protein [Sphingomonas sp.]